LPGEYGKATTWRRIGILVGILAALVLAQWIWRTASDPFTEHSPPRAPGFVEIPGTPRFRLIDRDDDGRVDCALQVPAMWWARHGYARDGAEGCSGRHVEKMPEELAVLADEALALQTEHRLSIARLLDVDGDGRVDCATYDGTWRYADGANCPDRRRSDAVPFTDADRLAADRLLAIEGEIRERWLEPLIRD